MKKVLIITAVLFGLNVHTAKADLTFKLASPVDTVKSVGGFVADTGEKLCEGVTTTVFGIGEIITAPFRAKFKKPKTKTYYFDAPKLEIERGELYEIKPLRPQGVPLQPKTHRIPVPIRNYNIKYVAAK